MEFDIRLIRRHWLMLASCTLTGIAAGILYLVVVPKTYHTQARVLIERQVVSPEFEVDRRLDPEFLPTQVETIRSPVTILQALDAVPVLPPPGQEAENFDPVRHVLKSLTVTPILRANVITIGFSGTDPVESEALISAIVDSYREHVAKLDKRNTNVSTDVLVSREGALRDDLVKAQDEYDELRRNSPVLGQGREASAQAVIELNELRNELATIRTRRAMLVAKLRSIDNVAGKTLVNQSSDADGGTRFASMRPSLEDDLTYDLSHVLKFADQADVRTLQTLLDQHEAAQLEVEQLDQVYGPLHPDLIAAKAEAVELKNRVNRRVSDTVQAWKSELDVIVATEEQLNESYRDEQEEAKSAETFLVKEEFLKGNIERLEQLHAATSTQLSRIQSTEQAIASGRTSIEVRILDGPVLVDGMTWPTPKLLLPTAACLGMCLGLGLVVLRGWQEHQDGQPGDSQ